MSRETNENAILEQQLVEAKLAEDQAFEHLSQLARKVRSIERNLKDKQRWLRAFLGEDDKLRNQLVDSAEWDCFDPIAVQKEIVVLCSHLRKDRLAWKQANENLDKAKEEERKAFYSLHRHRHREAVVQALQMEIALFEPLRAEQTSRVAVAEREGVSIGSFPVCCRTDFAQFDITSGQSGVCHRIREAVKNGYLQGDESFLSGVAWRQTAAETVATYQAPPRTWTVVR